MRQFVARALLLLVPVLVSIPASQPARAEGLLYPLGAVRAADGTLYVVDRNLPGVWQVRDGVLSPFFQGSKQFRTPLNAARCIALDKDGHVLVGDSSTREVYRFVEPGQPVPLTKGGIGIPMAIAVADDGTIYVADLELHRIFKVPHEGGSAEIIATVSAPRGLAFDPDGRLLVASTTSDQIHRVDLSDGSVTTVVPGRPFEFTHNIAVTADGTLFVTDGYGRCVWKIGADGPPRKLVSGPPLDNPVGLSLSGETLLVTDPRANAVFELSLDGTLRKLEFKPAE